jgi:hypothetical protein
MNKSKLSKATQEEEFKKKKEKYLEMHNQDFAENKTFTPVTKESFEEWFKKFYAARLKKSKAKLEQESRLSGREYFMNLKNKGLGDEGEGVEGEDTEGDTTGENNAFFFDPEAFDDNIDDIDFGADDI